MPNKTIYVSDDDLALYQRAQELAGNLSAAISQALRRYVEIEEGRQEGYDEIVLRVGTGAGRKQRFTGVLLGEWGRATKKGRVETYRVYRSRTGKFVVHTERSPEASAGTESVDGPLGWRSYLGLADTTWGFTQGEATLEIFETLADLKEKVPSELYEMIAGLADQPAVEDLDI